MPDLQKTPITNKRIKVTNINGVLQYVGEKSFEGNDAHGAAQLLSHRLDRRHQLNFVLQRQGGFGWLLLRVLALRILRIAELF